MNKKQKAVLLLTAIILAAMILYPPYIFKSGNHEFSVGYKWVLIAHMKYASEDMSLPRGFKLKPETLPENPYMQKKGSKTTQPNVLSNYAKRSLIDITTLLVQYLFTITIGGLLFFLFKDEKGITESKSNDA